MKKVALIIGHKETAQGAVSFTGETEYQFNKKVALEVSKNFEQSELQVFDKSHNYVSKILFFNPDLIIELHFNAFKEIAYGCEGLALKSSNSSISAANELLDSFSSKFKIKKRGVKELSQPIHRGFRNFNGLRRFTMILFEPCFGNFCTSDSKKIILNWQDYSNFLTDFIGYKLEYTERINKSWVTKMAELIRSWF